VKRRPTVRVLLWAALTLLHSAFLSGQEVDPRFHLGLGDPRFRHDTVDVAPGQIIALESGRPVSFEAMIQDLKEIPIVNVGEAHDSLPTHDLQARIIRALWEQDPRLAVGLEMVPAARQEVLTRWSLGRLTEDEFLRQAGWYANWDFNFGFYRAIFIFAREHKIPLYALDTPGEVAVRLKVRDGEMRPVEEEPIPPDTDPADEDGRFLMRMKIRSSTLGKALRGAALDRMVEDLFRAQVGREKDMAGRVVHARRLEGRRVVVLIGSGHILYGLGLNRFVREMGGPASKSVVPVSIPRGRPSVTVTRSLADYIVGVPAEERPAYPSLGLTFKAVPDSSRPVVASRPGWGAARGYDFEKGDLVISVDGMEFSDVESLLVHLAAVPWGGEVQFRLLRAGVEKTVILKVED
jgi:uncharacterized iron-regulated protein